MNIIKPLLEDLAQMTRDMTSRSAKVHRPIGMNTENHPQERCYDVINVRLTSVSIQSY